MVITVLLVECTCMIALLAINICKASIVRILHGDVYFVLIIIIIVSYFAQLHCRIQNL